MNPVNIKNIKCNRCNNKFTKCNYNNRICFTNNSNNKCNIIIMSIINSLKIS